MKQLLFLKNFKWRIIMALASQLAIFLVIPAMIVVIILSPIVGGMDNSGASGKTDTEESGDFWEQLGNFLNFRGWNTNEQIFYTKIKDANDTYGTNIDLPLILATIYYPFDVAFKEKINNCLNMEKPEENKACQQYDIDYGTKEEDNTGNNDGSDDEGDSGSDDVIAYIAINGRFDALKDKMLGAAGPNYEQYDKYLKTDYIPKSPEFGYPWGITDLQSAELGNRIDSIIQDIHARAKLYQDLFSEVTGVSFGDQRFQSIVNSGLLQLPIKGSYHISSCFGFRMLGENPGQHKGNDIVIDGSDKNIYSASDGIIIGYRNDLTTNCYVTDKNGKPDINANHACGSNEQRGNYVQVKSMLDKTDGYHYIIYYEHLSSVDPAIVSSMQLASLTGEGIPITKGTKIGVVGTTGHSDGNHLHFEIQLDGGPINPGYYLFSNPTSVGDNCPALNAGDNGGDYKTPQGPAATRIVEVGRAMADSEYSPKHDVYNTKTIDYKSPRSADALGWRSATYKGDKEIQGGSFHTDCNGFVGLVMREALPEIGMPKTSSSSTVFTTFGPSGGHWVPRNRYESYFKVLRTGLTLSEMRQAITSGGILAGDVIGFNPIKQYCDGREVSTHVAIYAGNNHIIENSGGLKYRSFDQSRHVKCDDSKYTIIRFTGSS